MLIDRFCPHVQHPYARLLLSCSILTGGSPGTVATPSQGSNITWPKLEAAPPTPSPQSPKQRPPTASDEFKDTKTTINQSPPSTSRAQPAAAPEVSDAGTNHPQHVFLYDLRAIEQTLQSARDEYRHRVSGTWFRQLMLNLRVAIGLECSHLIAALHLISCVEPCHCHWAGSKDICYGIGTLLIPSALSWE